MRQARRGGSCRPSAAPCGRARARLSWLGVAACLLAAAAPVLGQEPRMRVWAGFDGTCKEARWLPLAVEVTNQGEELRGTLEVPVPSPDGRRHTTYARPIVLGSRARQTFTLYLRGVSYGGRPTVRLRSNKGTFSQQPASVVWLTPADSLIAVLAHERGTLSFLSGTSRAAGPAAAPPWAAGVPSAGGSQVRVADCRPEELPDLPYGYDGVDLLVLAGAPLAAIRPEARQAIARWVQNGGSLVVVGGADWARLRDPFLAELLPVAVHGAAEVPALTALAGLHGPREAAPGPVVIPRTTPKLGASVHLRQGELPLIVEGRVGSGRVVFLAFDPTRAPVRGWSGQQDLWIGLLDRAQSGAVLLSAGLVDYTGYGYGGTPEPVDQLASAVLNVPAMRVPAFWGVAAFLAAYVVLLVPVNYLVLKWRRRREWAWLTTPAIVIVFVVIAYAIGYGMKGGKMVVNQLTAIETQAGAKAAAATTYAGLFSPARRAYDVGTDDPQAMISEASLGWDRGRSRRDLTVLQTDVVSLPEVAIDMWSMRVFRIDGSADLGGGVDASLTLRADGHLVGTVTNRTGAALEDCFLAVGGGVHRLGPLADGAPTSVDIAIGGGLPAPLGARQVVPSGGPGPAYGASVEQQLRAQVSQILVNPYSRGLLAGRAVLLAWSSRRAATLTVDGRATNPSHRTLLLVHLPLAAASRGQVFVPSGLSEGLVLDEQGTRWEWEQGASITDGYLVKEFRLPLGGKPLAVEKLQVHCALGGSPGTAKLQLYRWDSGAWETLPSYQGDVSAPDPARYVRLPQGLVRVRFAHHPAQSNPSGAGVTLNALDVSLRGRR